MLQNATLEKAVVNITLNEVVLTSDTGDTKYISWDNIEAFMYIWSLLQTIKNHTDISYVYTTKAGVRR